MTFSTETLQVLKNFAGINLGLIFKKGSHLVTMAKDRSILAEADITEKLPSDFAIYDLNKFLGVFSLLTEPNVEFEDGFLKLTDKRGRTKLRYTYSDPSTIDAAPSKKIEMPKFEVKFKLTEEDYVEVVKAASMLSAPQLAVESDGESIFITALDVKNPTGDIYSLKVGDGDGKTYRLLFRTSNWKFLKGSYDVQLSAKKVSQFTATGDLKLKYFIALEDGSSYGDIDMPGPAKSRKPVTPPVKADEDED